jgi:hypothetical protein
LLVHLNRLARADRVLPMRMPHRIRFITQQDQDLRQPQSRVASTSAA